MVEREPDSLPQWFIRPRPVTRWQRCLFTTSFQRVLVEMRISPDEVAAWHDRGWLSFDGADNPELDDLDDPRIWQLTVVRDITRSGLSDAHVEYLLQQLPKPCAVNPDRLAFSFRYGWVEAAEPEEPDSAAIVEEHLDTWLGDRDQEQLRELRDRITELLGVSGEGTPEEDE
jgi:hypothetical protein